MGVFESSMAGGMFYIAPCGSSVSPAAPTAQAADAVVSQMERHLVAACEAERRWRQQHQGDDHPVFRDPITGLGVFGLLL